MLAIVAACLVGYAIWNGKNLMEAVIRSKPARRARARQRLGVAGRVLDFV